MSDRILQGGKKKPVKIIISTFDHLLTFELFEKKKMSQGERIKITEGAELVLESIYGRKAFGLPELVALGLEITKDVAIGVIAARLYDKLKGRRIEKLTIDEEEIEIEENEIKRVLKRKIEIRK